MPPKKDSSAALAAILSVSHDEQVDLLSQALLREYMHKKQYSSTLKTFDEENPRDERTISSRALMSELMYVSPELQQKLKADGIETIMEMLCSIRVEKGSTGEERWRELHGALGIPIPAIPSELKEQLAALEAQLKKLKKRVKKEKAEKIAQGEKKPSGLAGEEDSAPAAAVKKKKKKILSIDELLEQDDTAKIQKEKKSAKQAATGKPTIVEESAPVVKSSARPLETHLAQPEALAKDSDSSESDSDSDSSEDDYAASLRRIKEEEAQAILQRHKAKGWSGDVEPLEDDNPSEKTTTTKVETAANRPREELQAKETHHNEPTIGPLVAEEIRLALVHDRRLPNSFWCQGLYFSADVPYGLMQHEGGPCGVIAVVQARLIADLFGNGRILTEEVKKSSLVESVLATLLTIQKSPRAVVVVHTSHHFSGKSNKEQTEAISKFHIKQNFSSVADIRMYLAEVVLRNWMDPKGHGLLGFLISCLLSRTVKGAQSDMDVESPLIVEHGYCSQELTNLLLCGKAVSNCHDGVISHQDLALKGYTQTLDVGFVSYMEHRQLLTVGLLAKSPLSPVWVVNHESHYTTLFMKKDQRKSIDAAVKEGFQTTPVFDVFFWDQLGGQTDEIRLTVTLEKTAVPTVGKDVIVPYLNDIIRTIPNWKTARVAWNGTDPLL